MYIFANTNAAKTEETIKKYAADRFGTQDEKVIRQKLHFYLLTIQPENGGFGILRLFNEEPIDSPKKAEAAIIAMSQKGVFKNITKNFKFTFNEIPYGQFIGRGAKA